MYLKQIYASVCPPSRPTSGWLIRPVGKNTVPEGMPEWGQRMCMGCPDTSAPRLFPTGGIAVFPAGWMSQPSGL